MSYADRLYTNLIGHFKKFYTPILNLTSITLKGHISGTELRTYVSRTDSIYFYLVAIANGENIELLCSFCT